MLIGHLPPLGEEKRHGEGPEKTPRVVVWSVVVWSVWSVCCVLWCTNHDVLYCEVRVRLW